MYALVVDEDKAFANVVARALKKDGHEVVIAASGEEALTRIQQSTPKLVLIDLMMPQINGLQLLLVLKGDSATSHIPVVVWTATVSEDLTKQALSFGADAMLIKARFSMGELRRLAARFMPDGTLRDGSSAIKRVLVVEDDDGTREAVLKHLGNAGYAVQGVENGWEALLALDHDKIDLIVLDLVMPGMDGPTFLRILKNSAKHEKIPVVVLTAYDIVEMKELVQPLGANHVMGKRPPLWDELLPTVRSALEAA